MNPEDYMSNEEIAERLSKLVFNNSQKDDRYAMQLFVGRVVLPKDTDGYTLDQLEKYILKYIKSL